MESSQPHVNAASAPLTYLRQRPFYVATAVVLLVLGLQMLFKRTSEWEQVYHLAARQLLAGEDIYGAGSLYLYPPFMALLAVPFTMLPHVASRVLWFAVNAACMVAMVVCAWRVAGGGTIQGEHRDKRELYAALIGFACGATFILNAHSHQQTDILIGGLLMVGCARLMSQKEVSGGVLIGFAAACKATPMLWCPYLLLRRRFLAGILVGAVALGVNLVPNVIASPPGGGTWLERWVTRFVLPSQQLGSSLGTWGSDLIYNQSLGGTTQRLVNTRLEMRDGRPEVVARPAVDTATLKLVYYLMVAVLLAVSVFAGMRATGIPAAAWTGGLSPAAFEFGIVLTLMPLLSPMSGAAHFGTLVLPGFALARYALINKNRTIGVLVGAAAAIALLCNKDPIGNTAYSIVLWIGSVTLATLLLWLGCVLVLARHGRSAATVAAPAQSAPLS